MIRTLALVVLVAAGSVRAQTGNDEAAMAILLTATSAPALLFDVLIAKNLFDDGTVRKGLSINACIFGAIATTAGVGFTAALWGDTRTKPIWTPLGASLAIVGVGTVVLAIWGMLHVRRPAEAIEVLPGDPAPGPFTPSPPPPSPLPEEIPLIRVMPLFGVSPSGALLFGVSGTL